MDEMRELTLSTGAATSQVLASASELEVQHDWQATTTNRLKEQFVVQWAACRSFWEQMLACLATHPI
ncbi:MAG: hypothetical protein AAF941_05995 [Pseudomonadota bacterium]